MAVDPSVVQAAGAALGVALHSPERLESPNLVFRASADDGGTVVVKRVTMTEWNRGDGDESEQLLNEWCVLDHLGGHVAPRLLAVDRAASLIVIEDLGNRETLENTLLDGSSTNARSLLEQAGESLAAMHRSGVGRETEFLGMQHQRSTLSPRSDSTVDFRVERIDLFNKAFETLGVDVHRRFWDEVARMEEAVHDGGLFRTLIHADAGPQNFLIGEEMRMIDFEFGIYLNAMCDVGGARVGFPQTWETRSVALDDSEVFERSYRQAVADFWPEANDDVFEEHLLFGSGHWALNRLAGGWQSVLDEMIAGTSSLDDAELRRSHYATLWTSFCDAADRADLLGPISQTLRAVLVELQRRFPDMKPLKPYPALEGSG